MAARNSDQKDKNVGFSINSVKNICSKYKKYIATGAMLILLAVVVSTSQKASGSKEPSGPAQNDPSQDGQDTQKVEINAYPQINALFEDYYEYYAKGDTKSIGKIAFPISDTEKSYIECFSKCIESYEDINCYTKEGIADGEYAVIVVTQMKFPDIVSTAPEMASFYIRSDEKGNFYIDNAYSSFNQDRKENTMDVQVNTLLTEFGENEDIIAIQKDVWKDLDKAVEKDEDLKTMIYTTMPNILSEWVASFSPQTSADDEKEDGKKDESGKDGDAKDDGKGDSKEDHKDNTPDTSKDPDEQEPDKSDDQKPENPDETDTSEQTRTAYAKTKVNMREKRSTDSEILQTLNAGTKVTIYGKSQDGWFKVKCKGKTGYISKEYIVSDPSKVQVPKRTAYAKTTVNMRKKQSTDSDVVQTLKAGTKVMLYGKSKDGWFRVRSKGKFGYVKKEYIVSSRSKVEKESSSQGDTSRPSTTYFNEGDRITLTDSVNIRTSMSENADRVGLAYQGDVVTVIMSYAEGWTKVSWNGQTGFAKTEYLR